MFKIKTRTYKRIGASEATNETADPEGRQAEWNGARLPVAN